MEDQVVNSELPLMQDAAAEKMLSQSQVNDIVKREKASAYEKAKREMEAARQQPVDQSPMGSQSFNEADFERRIYEKMLQKNEDARRAEAEAQHKAAIEDVTNKYFLKMGKGKETFQDFDEVMNGFEPEAFANTVILAAQLENTPEIMYELRKNPSKLAEIDYIANRSPDEARRMLQLLADSIASNKAAKEAHQNIPQPLSRLTPTSTNAGADTGRMTIRDLKKQPWLRG